MLKKPSLLIGLLGVKSEKNCGRMYYNIMKTTALIKRLSILCFSEFRFNPLNLYNGEINIFPYE